MGRRTRARVLTYGFAADADVRAEDVESAGLAGMRFTLVARRRAAAPRRRSRGSGGCRSTTRSRRRRSGYAAGLTLETIVEGARARLVGAASRAARPAGGVTIIDDSYNASPWSVRAALDLLAGLPGRRVAVLGEMLELGDATVTGHLEVGEAAAGRGGPAGRRR